MRKYQVRFRGGITEKEHSYLAGILPDTSDGRKVSYTQRMIDPSLPYEEGCKICRCVDNVISEYQRSNDILGTQLVFCDMATPKGQKKGSNEAKVDDDFDPEQAKIYEDMKQMLVAKGIPANEIAFIHDAKSDAQKVALRDDVNEGRVRVLIGSTGKMGVGMNVQQRVVAIHHLNAPWRPGDMEQRNGRAFRQGNINEEVSCYVYVTEGSFDARLWDILERKQKFITQAMNGETSAREVEDTGEITLSAAEIKALASGNDLMKEQYELENEINRLESLKRSHATAIAAAKSRLENDIKNAKTFEILANAAREDLQTRTNTYLGNDFSIKIGKAVFTDKREAGAAFTAATLEKANDQDYTTIAQCAGFDIKVLKTADGYIGVVYGAGRYKFNVHPNSPTHTITLLVDQIAGLEKVLESHKKSAKMYEDDIKEQKTLVNQPFAKQEELIKKRARYEEVMQELTPEDEQDLSGMDDDAQEQSRDYLEDDDGYLTQGVHWGVQAGIMTKADARAVWEAIANISKRGYYYPETKSGEHFIENENLLMVVDTDYRHPIVKTIYKFADKYESTIAFAKEDIINAKGVESETETALAVIEALYGPGYVTRYNFADRSSYEGENRGREGENGRENSGGSKEQYQQRTETLTDRDVLEMAASKMPYLEMKPEERATLDIFNDRLIRLKDLEEKRYELGQTYREQQFGANGVKVDRKAAEETRNRMQVMDQQIQRANADILSVQDKKVLQQVLHNARKVVEQEERKHGDEKLARWRDRRKNADAIKKYRTRIQKDVTDMSSWIMHPDNKDVVKHIPDVLKTSVIPFLSSIDMTSKRALSGGNPTKADAEFQKRLLAMQKALSHVTGEEMYSGFLDLPEDFMEKLQQIIETVQNLTANQPEDFVLNQMTSTELKRLSDVVRTVKKLVQECDVLHNQGMFHHAHEAGDSSISFMSRMNPAPSRGVAGQAVNQFLFWQQIRPAYAWERFGDGGKAIYNGFQQGQAKLAFDAKSIMRFAEETYSGEEVKSWENEVREIELDGDVIRLPVSHIMSFYELSKRPHALNHIISQAGGIRVATYKDGKRVVSDTGHYLTIEDVSTIIAELTPRQMEVADALQQYMAQVGGKWRNEINFIRFGEEAPIDEHYFPINSDGRRLESTADKAPNAASLYALLNMSFNKPLTEGANNRLILYSVFDVFANHMASMAQYHSMALPVLDALKWFNYRQTILVDRTLEYGTVKTERKTINSVRDELNRVYGVPEETRPGAGKKGFAEMFIINILRAFNGTAAQGTPMDSMGLKWLHLYNGAQIAYNLRVVMQQPLAIFRAGTILDHSVILKSFQASPAAVAADIKEMQEHSGIAAWKSLGFYDVNISRGLTATIKQDMSFWDKVMDVGLKGAEKADEITWAALWRACKLQTARRIPAGSENFMPAVTKLFEEVIYKTQVVDSVLTKNEFLRDKGGIARTLGSFMSEPTTTASMLLDAYDKVRMDMQRGLSRRAAISRNKGMIVRTAYTYGISAIILAAVQAVADGWRDDDDYESAPEKWMEAFIGNVIDELMPFNKLPLISDVYEISKEILHRGFGVDTYGNPPRSFNMQWYDSLVKGFEILHDKATGDDTNYTWYGGAYKLLQAVSGIAGLPMAAATREIVNAWNNTIGYFLPDLKIKTYDPGDLKEIQYAYQDGYLTAGEAVKHLYENDLVENADDAYWTIRKWDDKDGEFSRFDDIYMAVRNGGAGFDAAMSELTSHGYTEKEVMSRIKSQIGSWYKDGEIPRQAAEYYLSDYFDMSAEDVAQLVNEWSCKVVTGIDYNDLKDQFMAGSLSEQQAIEMRKTYGGETQSEAQHTIGSWKFEADHGFTYGGRREAYLDGDISRADLISALKTQGGMTSQEAETQAKIYDWQKAGYDIDSGATSFVEDYETFCVPAGVGRSAYYSAWKFYQDAGQEGVRNSKVKETMPYIGQLDLTPEQKTALARCFWQDSTINRYKTW